MAKNKKEAEFVVIRVFPPDYRRLLNIFGGNEAIPPMGMLVSRALEHMDEMASEIRELKDEIEGGNDE